MGDCKQDSYKDFNLTEFDKTGKEFSHDICNIFDVFKVSGYVVIYSFKILIFRHSQF